MAQEHVIITTSLTDIKFHCTTLNIIYYWFILLLLRELEQFNFINNPLNLRMLLM